MSDPDSEQFRDYTTLEWWRVPARTGTRHLTGPYVDYLCTDDYTVTITTPVRVEDEMAGLVGTDLYVARLEEVLLPVIRESGHPCTLVNASGRIVASTDARRATGALLRLDGLAEALAPAARRRAGHGCREPARRRGGRAVRRHVARARARGLNASAPRRGCDGVDGTAAVRPGRRPRRARRIASGSAPAARSRETSARRART